MLAYLILSAPLWPPKHIQRGEVWLLFSRSIRASSVVTLINLHLNKSLLVDNLTRTSLLSVCVCELNIRLRFYVFLR